MCSRLSKYKEGDQIVVKDGRVGVIRYVGTIEGKRGIYLGIFLTDGSVCLIFLTSCENSLFRLLKMSE